MRIYWWELTALSAARRSGTRQKQKLSEPDEIAAMSGSISRVKRASRGVRGNAQLDAVIAAAGELHFGPLMI